MPRAYVYSRRLPVALGALAVLSVTLLAFFHSTGSARTRLREPGSGTVETRSTYPDHFETYVNYSGPRPIPAPIELPASFRFAINEPDTCSAERNPDLRILHYVHSAPQHFQQRKFIRRTWASSRFYSQFKMATVFFLGQTANERQQKLVERESARFKDIVQTNLPDNYYNLTFKAVSALAWVSQFCAQVEHVVKTDDDVFVNVFHLMELLVANDTQRDAIHCSVYANFGPHRNPKSKWFVDTTEYPWGKYPDFCAGMAVYYPGHLAPKLYEATLDVPYLKFDDVYATGLLRHRAGIAIKDLGSAVNIFSGSTCLQKGHKSEVFCHVASAKLKEDLWLQLMQMEIKERAMKNVDVREELVEALANILD